MDSARPRLDSRISAVVDGRGFVLVPDAPSLPLYTIDLVPGIVEAGTGRSADPPAGDIADARTRKPPCQLWEERGGGGEERRGFVI